MRCSTTRSCPMVLMLVLLSVPPAQGIQLSNPQFRPASNAGSEGSEAAAMQHGGPSASECDASCSDPCLISDRCCGPLWSVTADVLFLQRRDPARAVLMENTMDPAQSLNAGQFNFDFETGCDMSIVRRRGCNNALEIRYFGVDQWDALATSATTPGSLLRVNTALPVFTLAGTAMTGRYDSQLHNAEFNAHHYIGDRLSVLAGFRYAELDDSLSLSLVNSAIPFTYNTVTQNRLYGMQLGGRGVLWNCGALTIDAVGKAGLYVNEASQDSLFSTGVVTLTSRGQRDPFAFIGEIGLTGTYCLTNRLSLRGGYRLLWIDRVALATDQVAATAFVPPAFAPGRGIDDTGDVFYHGAFVGLQYER